MSRLKDLLQLDERSAWHVLGAYAVGAWVVLQIAETLSSLVGLPLWFGRFVLILLAIGLPVLLVTAWLRSRWRIGEADHEANSTSGIKRVVTWRNALGGGLIAFGLLGIVTSGYMAMRAMGIGPPATLLAQGTLVARDTLVIADFESPDARMVRTVGEMLRIDLVGSDVVNLMSRDRLRNALERMGRGPDDAFASDIARELAIREGLKGVIVGSILPVGDGFVLTVELIATEDGAVLVALRETARDADEVILAIEQLSARLRERIGESLRLVQRPARLSRVTTSSLLALQKYIEGSRLFSHRGDYQSAMSAVALMEEAVAIDSTFAYAYRTLGIIAGMYGLGIARRTEYMERAMRHRHSIPERERLAIEGAYHMTVTRDDEAAVRAYQRLLSNGDTTTTTLVNLGAISHRSRHFEQALAWRQLAWERGSRIWQINQALIELPYALGRSEEAVEAAHRAMEVVPDTARWDTWLIRIAFADGDYEAARAAIDEFERRYGDDTGWNLNVPFYRAALARVQGRYEEAAREIRELAEGNATRGDQRWALTHSIQLALLRLEAEDRGGAQQALQEALRRYPLESISVNTRPYFGVAEVTSGLGRPQEARAMIEQWTLEVEPDIADPRGVGTAWADAWVALSEDRPMDAVRLFRENDRGFACPICSLDEIGLAYDRASMPDSTIAIYERYLSTPWARRDYWEDAPSKPRILERLGQLYDERGDRAQAIEYYTAFVELWAEADAELQPRVRRARARLQQIAGESGG